MFPCYTFPTITLLFCSARRRFHINLFLGYESHTGASKLDSNAKLGIKVIPDKDANMLTIIDSDIGMTKAD